MFSFDSQGPTIIELLTYWVACALGLPGAFKIPEVGGEPPFVQRLWPATFYDFLRFNREAAIALAFL